MRGTLQVVWLYAVLVGLVYSWGVHVRQLDHPLTHYGFKLPPGARTHSATAFTGALHAATALTDERGWPCRSRTSVRKTVPSRSVSTSMSSKDGVGVGERSGHAQRRLCACLAGSERRDGMGCCAGGDVGGLAGVRTPLACPPDCVCTLSTKTGGQRLSVPPPTGHYLECFCSLDAPRRGLAGLASHAARGAARPAIGWIACALLLKSVKGGACDPRCAGAIGRRGVDARECAPGGLV